MSDSSQLASSLGLSNRYLMASTVAFGLGWMVVNSARTAPYSLLPVIGQQFGLSGAQTGIITSAYFLFYVALQVPCGIVADRIGPKRVLVPTYLVLGIALALIGLLDTAYWPLLLLMGLQGTGAGGFYPTAYGMTVRSVPYRFRGFSAAILNAGMAAGNAVGLIGGAWLYTVSGSWHLPFLVLAFPAVAMAAVFQFFLRDLPPAPRARIFPVELLRHRDFMALTIAEFCSLFGFWTAIVWGPSFFQSERNIGLANAGMYTAIIAVSALPAGLIIGRLADHVGRRRLSITMLPIAALMVLALGFVQTSEALIVALVIYGFVGNNSWHPALIAWAGDVVAAEKPAAMGAALGFLNFAAMSSAVITPVMSGLVRDISGSFQWAFFIGSFMVMVAFALCLAAREAPRL